ncbi:MAG TPA: cyclopropane-fatty-acyl-phospholipid synthase family protein [Brevundimonas sp.]|jgi:cyclopropane-fatty-acyl-phospholipid synthase|uniref:cyclopropane-fatty-acyl-phospholipid synthase family protein n=1 Tax=Brevundimonas sp. TaxID=1871086 RepID=UPI002E13784F|nr:cyclopropane-fatty-acyl-phospholipid synthase family protein [Brevundimonas sp.]
MTMNATREELEAGAAPDRSAPPLFGALARLWEVGRLTVVLPGGQVWRLGEAHAGGPEVEWRIQRWNAVPRMLRRGAVGFAEGYIAGDWDTPDLVALLLAFAANYDRIGRLTEGSALARALGRLRHALARNSRAGSRRNIMAHYDLGNDFYAAWLDGTMTYSSALWTDRSLDLAEAQTAKYAALADASDIRPGQTVLEIGCGWGGFAEYLARERGVHVTGITLSPAQAEFARERLQRAGLSDRTDIRLVDYRDVEGRYDRIVSVEMFEAVGEAWWPVYFRRLRELLTPGGVAGLQLITIDDRLFESYRRQADFIQLHVFPGGMLPSEARLAPVIAGAGLTSTVVRRFGPDYGRTLRLWLERFDRAWPTLPAGFDTRFQRLWRYYLAYCAAGFESGRTDVIHLVARAD